MNYTLTYVRKERKEKKEEALNLLETAQTWKLGGAIEKKKKGLTFFQVSSGKRQAVEWELGGVVKNLQRSTCFGAERGGPVELSF